MSRVNFLVSQKCPSSVKICPKLVLSRVLLKYELSKYYLLELENLCHSILVPFHVLHLKENMKLLLVLNECMKLDCLFEWIKVEKICNAQKYCVLIKLYFGYTKGLRSRRLSLFLLWRIPLRFSQSLKVCQANVSRLHPSLYILCTKLAPFVRLTQPPKYSFPVSQKINFIKQIQKYL